jgi:hypothetical protein
MISMKTKKISNEFTQEEKSLMIIIFGVLLCFATTSYYTIGSMQDISICITILSLSELLFIWFFREINTGEIKIDDIKIDDDFMSIAFIKLLCVLASLMILTGLVIVAFGIISIAYIVYEFLKMASPLAIPVLLVIISFGALVYLNKLLVWFIYKR